MSDQNPFAVLGLASDALKGLSDEEIMSLVQSQYRTFAAMFHPDRRRLNSTQRFKEVQEAMETLREPTNFAFAKTIYCRNRKDRAVRAEEEKKDVLRELASVNKTLVDFWHAFFVGAVSARSTSGELHGVSVFGNQEMRLLVADHFGRLLVNRANRQNREGFGGARDIPMLVQQEAESMQGYFELRVSADGKLMRQDLVRAPFQFRKGWNPPVEPALVQERKTRTQSYYWENEGRPKRIFGKLVGSIPINSLSIDKKSVFNPDLVKLLPGTVTAESFDLVTEGFTFDEFSSHLKHIKPFVDVNSYLIVVRGDERKNFRFLLIGCAKKFLPLNSKVTKKR